MGSPGPSVWDWTDNLKAVKNKLLHSLDQPEINIFPLIDRVIKNEHFVSNDVILKPIEDINPIALPANCKLEQAAVYVDDNLLLIKKEIWDAFDSANQAALVMHEAIYRFERYGYTTDSRRARKIVAHLFSDFQFVSVHEGESVNTFQRCYTLLNDKLTYEFNLVPSSTGTKAQFLLFNSEYVYSKKTAIIPLKYPWFGDQVSSNIAGGATESNFESGDTVVIGYEEHIQAGAVTSYYYISDENGKNIMTCNSIGVGPWAPDKLSLELVPDQTTLVMGSASSCGDIMNAKPGTPPAMSVEGPYYINLRNLTMKWEGASNFYVNDVQVEVEEGANNSSAICDFIQNEYQALFYQAHQLSPIDQTIFAPKTSKRTTCPMTCGGISLKDSRKPATFNGKVKIR